MSTKIHSGYRLSGVSTLSELQAWWRELSSKALALREELVRDLVLSTACRFLDADSLGRKREQPDASPYIAAMYEIQDKMAEIERTQRRNPRFDFEFCLSVLPVADATLFILYTEQKSLTDLVERDPRVTEYSYWNNTDRRDDITQAEWQKRAADWDEALSAGGIPAHNGFKLSLSDPGAFGTWLDGEISQAAHSERALKEARSHVVNWHFRKHYAPYAKDTSMCMAMECLDEAGKFADGDGADLIRRLAVRFERRLHPTITKELLLAEPSK